MVTAMRISSVSERTVDRWVHQYANLKWSCREICEGSHNDYDIKTIYRHIKKRGVKMRMNPYQFDISMFIQDWNAGKPCEYLASRYGFDNADKVRMMVTNLRARGYELDKRGRGFAQGHKLWKLRKWRNGK